MKLSLMYLCLIGFSLVVRAETDSAPPQKMNDALKNARCVPNFENGRPAGYKCFQDGAEVSNTSDGKGVALKDSDVITDIDGKPASNPAKAFGKLDSKKARKITVKIERRSAPESPPAK